MFKSKKLLPVLALTAALSWGFAFPLIKLGLIEFQIDGSDTGGKALFAGIRFLLAGLVVLGIALFQKRSLKVTQKKDWLWLVLFALVNTSLHYFFFYIGVSNSHGSRASVLDALSTFLLVFLACLFFKEEHLTAKKIVGCLIGFSGIVILNLGNGLSGLGGEFTVMGDGMMFVNSICSAFGGILTRVICKKLDALFATGVSLSLGGVILVLCGKIMCGQIGRVNWRGCLILLMLVCVSAVSFSIYNQLLRNHPVGQVAIYNSFIPIFGSVLSCLLLGEKFNARYVVAAVLVSMGVFIINHQRGKAVNEET